MEGKGKGKAMNADHFPDKPIFASTNEAMERSPKKQKIEAINENRAPINDIINATKKWMEDDLLSSQAKPFGLEESLNHLRKGDTVLIMGEMGAGKSTLINALIGEHLFPTSVGGRVGSDTLTVIEFFNNEFLPEDEIEVRIVLKSDHQWQEDFGNYLVSLDKDAFEIADTGDQVGAPNNGDLLRAVYPRCYDLHDDTERKKVVEWIDKNDQKDDQPPLPSLYNDDKILNAIDSAKRLRILSLSSAEEARNVLDILCRAQELPLNAIFENPKYDTIRDLILLGAPWPLVHHITVARNASSRGSLPPFARILDSPGLGGFDADGVVSSIQKSVFDRVVFEVWYVNSMMRCTDKVASFQSMIELQKFVGLDRTKFIYTHKDLILPDDEGKTRNQLAKRMRDVAKKFPGLLDFPDDIIKKIFFVSAFGHAVWSDISLGIPHNTTSSVREVIKNVGEANVIHVVRDLWANSAKNWKDHRDSAQTVFAKLGDACFDLVKILNTSNVQAPNEQAPNEEDSYPDLQTLFSKRKDAKSIFEKAPKPLDDFISKTVQVHVNSQSIRKLLEDSLAQEIENKLNALQYQTFRSLLKATGKFTSTGKAGTVDIGRLIWSKVEASPPANVLSKAYHLLFGAFQIKCEEAIDTIVQVFEDSSRNDASCKFAIDQARRNAKKSMSDSLQELHQYYSNHQTVGEVLREVEEYIKVWGDVNLRNEKKKKACLIIRERLLGETGITPKACLIWAKRLRKSMVDKLEIELSKLCASLNLALNPLSTKIQDPFNFLDLLLKSGCLVGEQSVRAQEAVKVGRPKGVPNPRPDDNLWIEGNYQGSRCYLLFRGLCGLDDTEDECPPLLFQHQALLKVIVPEHDNPAQTDLDLSLANSLAASSAATLLEATISSDRDPTTIRFLSPTEISESLTVEGLTGAADSIRKEMLFFDDATQEPEKNYWRPFQKHKRADWLTPALDRQSLYTNTTRYFLEDWPRYRNEFKTSRSRVGQEYSGQENRVICPLGGTDTSNAIRAWFHWRWCSPDKFKIFWSPHFAQIHPNPFVSCSQQPEHALRYAAGLKNYRVAQDAGTLLEIKYDERLKSKEKGILGVVIVIAIKKSYVDQRDDVRVVLQLRNQGKITLKGGEVRIGAEAEVTMYGGIPLQTEDAFVLFRFPLIAPDLDDYNGSLEKFFGITSSSNPAYFKHLQDAAKTLAKATDENRESAQLDMRRQLIKALGRHMKAKLGVLKFGINIDSSVLNR